MTEPRKHPRGRRSVVGTAAIVLAFAAAAGAIGADPAAAQDQPGGPQPPAPAKPEDAPQAPASPEDPAAPNPADGASKADPQDPAAAGAQDPAAPAAPADDYVPPVIPGLDPNRPVSVPGVPPPASPTTPPQGTSSREGMWPAPTAADWAKPVLITWQRTIDDAIAVSRRTGKPLLLCINMDGEIASEHWAGVRYRQPETAKLYEGYVCVIASVYRHNPRDYDDQGRRIPCPRFGGVTCGEHITIEPILYEKYLDGARIAPRHIMVELDGKEVWDIYYANDTESVASTIRDGIVKRGFAPPPPEVRGDRPIAERVASPDVADRVAVEDAWQKADADGRRAMADAALARGKDAPLDLLRLAVFGLDADASRKARATLAQAESKAAVDLIHEALRVPMEDAEREALIAALERIGKASPRAQWLAVAHRGLSAKSESVDVKLWAKTFEAAPAAVAEQTRSWYELEKERTSRQQAHAATPESAEALLEFAESSLELARRAPSEFADDPKLARAFARGMFRDALRTARRAEEMKATPWRVNSIVAVSAYHTGDYELAYAKAEAAVRELPPGEGSWSSMVALTIFAESRWKAIKDARREKRRWPAKWLTDVNATYSVLRRHPLGTDGQVVWHSDFLVWLGVNDQAARVLTEGVARFPWSEALHEKLRKRVVEDRGVEALEPVYDEMLRAKDASPALHGSAGSASMLAAESLRKTGAAQKSLAAYDRAVAHFESAILADPSSRDWADHRIALALAGKARVSYEAGDLEASLAQIVGSFERRPDSAGDLDGLGITPAATGLMLLEKLKAEKRTELVAKLEAAIAKLDPSTLIPKNEE